MPLRIVCSVVLIALAAAAPTAAAPSRAAGISPGLVHRGQKTTITVATGTRSAPCVASLRYANRTTQRAASRLPHGGHVSFVFKVPSTAALGQGGWRVQCGLGYWTGTFVVVDAQSTTAKEAPRVVVGSQGYSQRPDKSGPGSFLSYGLVLRNTSASEDAESVYVIVNMVAADGSLIGSKSQGVPIVPAGGTYALGASMQLRTQAAVTHLEIVVRVGAHEPKQAQTLPDLANLRIEPSLYDPGWVGEIDGEIVNDTTPKTLSSASLSIVVFDAAGNPIGGGTGSLFASVPSGARFVFTAMSGFKSIPLDKAASVAISITPRYSTA